ncbi:MAG: S1/P1 nuclease [Zymomonas mobilis]|uniref:S1/P1 nuclease n=1 Tax=Zymomonas mobilis TaxID=542 RepID=A0A542VZD6_ZYMMB|nr:S1/P1 nuclease [Zymomonas mobilis]TQL16663.1 S1/P1 nuclease [Zymomonas mobilis]
MTIQFKTRKWFQGASIAITAMLALPQTAHAWGMEGHEAIAALAWKYMTPTTRKKVDALLAMDQDTLTQPDLMSRATWADKWRSAGHGETEPWHFIDIEIDHPNVVSACSAAADRANPASNGGAQPCVISQLDRFERQLSSKDTSVADRVLALKYVLHFVGDLHQPLHAADHDDRGGNCVKITVNNTKSLNLHSYWDTYVVKEIDPDPQHLADSLAKDITPADKKSWALGNSKQWAMESFQLGKRYAYSFHPPAGCDASRPPIPVSSGYDSAAQKVATLQLKKAGVRLAYVLNHRLRSIPLSYFTNLQKQAPASDNNG